MSSSGALASAHVLYEFGYHPQNQKIKFSSAGGVLNAELKSTKEIRVEMDQASADLVSPLLYLSRDWGISR